MLISVERVRGKEMVNFNNNYDELAMPGDWIPIVQKLQSQDGTVIVLGKSDSGKTSLIKLLTYFLVKRNRNIGIIDLDIGQSTLGLPATIAISTVDKKKLKDGNIPIEHMLFIGMISPAGCIDRFLDRICKLYSISQKKKIDTLIVDTTGLVMGSIGIYLKSSLINRINPAALVALQSAQELEPILSQFESRPSLQIYRIKPCQNIVQRSWRDRKLRREKQFCHYFRDSRTREVDFTTTTIRDFNFGLSFCSDNDIVDTIKQKFALEPVYAEKIQNTVVLILQEPQSFPGKDIFINIKKHLQVEQVISILPHWFQYFLISFNTTDGFSNGLGIIKNIDFEKKKITIYMPGSISAENFSEIELGQVRVKPDGTELPYNEPVKF
ncbi:MAG: Clp1/GlmU family protein [Atribacterota bacterium]|nr:Clp1/GlmU family protein [Atribacterota bacterium]